MAAFGIVLFFVGAVLLVNGMATLGKGDPRGGAFINLFVGGLTLFINLSFYVTQPFGGQSDYFAATGMLFSLTYLWNGFNALAGADGRGLGWFCLFVAVTTVPTAYLSLASDWRFSVFWLSWGVLWFLYHLILSHDQNGERLVKGTGYFTVLVAVATCWLPGYLILIDMW